MHYQKKNSLNPSTASSFQKEEKTDLESDGSAERVVVDRPLISTPHQTHPFPEKKKRRGRRRRRQGKSQQLVARYRPPHMFLSVPPRMVPSLPMVLHHHWSSTTARHHDGHHVALDCEMVGVGPMGKRSVLARVSLVSWSGNVVLDTFVKVTEPVTDYRTFVSGVRPSDLESPQAMDYGECRLLVHQYLQDKILVGHGLENDLKVLKLSHPWHLTRDTATYEPFMKMGHGEHHLRARKLQELAKSQLGMVIQGEEHDSIEDARCAMELYKTVQHEWDNVVDWKRQVEAGRY